MTDRAEARRGSGFRWFFSTCLAAAVGAVAIAAVIIGSRESSIDGAMPPELRTARPGKMAVAKLTPVEGLNWATPKADRLQASSDAMSTKAVVQETLKQRRGNREYIHHKFYARIGVRLAAVPHNSDIDVPPFNPVKLYGVSTQDGASSEGANDSEAGDVSVRVVELLGAILPAEDGQEMNNQEVTEIVTKLEDPNANAAIRPAYAPEGADRAASDLTASANLRIVPEPLAPNTSVFEKASHAGDDVAEEVDGKRVTVTLKRGDTLQKVLEKLGAPAHQAKEISDRAASVAPDAIAGAGLEVDVTLVPPLNESTSRVEPSRVTVSSAGGEHKVTVRRAADGELEATTTAIEVSSIKALNDGGGDERASGSSLYASLYRAGIAQGLSPDLIQQVMRIHAYETDFRRRARGNDGVDLFFDLKDDGKAADNPPSELLSAAITVGGETRRYFRFRTPDGVVDFYDQNGNNSRRFLMRKPIRSDAVRFVSGFGMRRHPLLNSVRMHTGVDWAGPVGTPILAAGNGVVEEARFRGQNGNYVRIRHANSYQTAYSHMLSRFGPGIYPGAKVRQGQVIGYLGNTGLSTGPHCHFEVLIGNRFVDPMSIQVPKERRLTGKALADFQRERARIEDLMRRPPVRLAQLEGR